MVAHRVEHVTSPGEQVTHRLEQEAATVAAGSAGPPVRGLVTRDSGSRGSGGDGSQEAAAGHPLLRHPDCLTTGLRCIRFIFSPLR